MENKFYDLLDDDKIKEMSVGGSITVNLLGFNIDIRKAKCETARDEVRYCTIYKSGIVRDFEVPRALYLTTYYSSGGGGVANKLYTDQFKFKIKLSEVMQEIQDEIDRMSNKPASKSIEKDNIYSLIEDIQAINIEAGGRLLTQSEIRNMTVEELLKLLVPNIKLQIRAKNY